MFECFVLRLASSSKIGSILKRFVPLAVGVGLLAYAPLSVANQVTTPPAYGPFQVFDGGEFTLIPDAELATVLGNYSPFTMNYRQLGSFQTFCVEHSERIMPDTTYDVTLNNITLFTGVPLSAGTAYLYEQFATGQLTYNYADSPHNGRRDIGTDNALTLQAAIWFLMGQTTGQENNPYVLQAAFALTNPFAPDNGAHHVSVLNLWAPNQPHDQFHSFQDQLIYTGVPEPSAFALLSLAGLLALRRRK